jgi:hypothetical protein
MIVARPASRRHCAGVSELRIRARRDVDGTLELGIAYCKSFLIRESFS